MDRTSIAALPPLREAIRRAGLSAKKSLGQNFLLDLNVTRRIARAAGPLDGVGVIEVGAGPGGLSRALLLEGAAKLIAVERDERFRDILAELEMCSGDRFTTLFADALKVDYGALAAETGACRIVANLPYNIATPLIAGWLTEPRWPPWFDRIVVMVQSEVAERFVASPASEHYGRLSILAQYRSTPRILFSLPASVFTPPPKVSSALVEFLPMGSETSVVSPALLEDVTAAAFGMRRKMLRSSLASLGVDTALLLRDADIDPTQRAERLSIADFVRLAHCLHEQRSGAGQPPRR
jgi:16S rRNA (adenine1518-N6/adenine1519-N6)-dimethyltransferase